MATSTKDLDHALKFGLDVPFAEIRQVAHALGFAISDEQILRMLKERQGPILASFEALAVEWAAKNIPVYGTSLTTGAKGFRA